MGVILRSRMTQTYVQLSGRDKNNAIKVEGIGLQDGTLIEAERPLNCLG